MYLDEETATVQHNDEECIGCQTCVNSCPYEVPQFFEEEKIVRKCDMCLDLVKQGENPACVDACMLRALEWGDIDELAAKHPEAVKDMAVLPDSSETGPHALYTLRDDALKDTFARKYI